MRHLIVPAIILATATLCTAQTTWYVPDDFPAGIQSAISDGSVKDGDTILVRPGAYSDNLDFLGKAIVVKSTSGPLSTGINGRKTGPVVTFQNNEGLDSVLEGFSLYDGSNDYGGGICCESSSPTIKGNRILTNKVTKDGGGISCRTNSTPSIIGNDIYSNIAKGGGGGIYIEYAAPVIEFNTIRLNHGWGGGGIWCEGNGTPVIQYNLIQSNDASFDGGGIYAEGAHPIIRGNTITQNEAFDGGAIWYSSRKGEVLIMDNLILENEAFNPNYYGVAAYGGGIYLYDSAAAVISGNRIDSNIASAWSFGAGEGGGVFCYCDHVLFENNIIVNNLSAWESGYTGSGISVSNDTDLVLINNTFAHNWGKAMELKNTGSAVITNCIFDVDQFIDGGNLIEISYSDIIGGPSSIVPHGTLIWGAGMVDADPLFVDPGQGDYHLTYPSPCRNTGDNSATGLPALDNEGDPRIAHGTVDMGADEFHPHLYHTGDATPSGAIEVKFIGLPGTLVNGVIVGVNIFEPPLPCDYGLWYMDNPMQIITGLGAIPTAGVLVVPGTIPGTPGFPSTLYLQGVIDMWLTNLCTLNVK